MEETNFDIMRYELDDDSYILNVYFGCASGTCIGYEGEVPEGYEDLLDWCSNSNIRAYKIVNGNLIYDANRDAALQKLYAQQEEDNCNASHKWVKDQLEKTNSVVVDEFGNTATGSSILVLNDSGGYEIPSLKVSNETIEKCNVVVSNKNLLGNDAITQTISGVTITINDNGIITLNGTATANIEMTLKGTSNNLDMLFLVQKNMNYVVSGLVTGTKINLYSYDGTDRTLVGSYSNESFNLSNSHPITQTTLNITSGTTFENVNIEPQIEINNVATEFVKHEENRALAELYNKETTLYELYSYYPISVIMTDEEVNIEVEYFKYKNLEQQIAKIEMTSEEIILSVSNMNDNFNSLQEEVSNNQKSSQESIDDIYNTLETGVSTLNNALVKIDVNGISVLTNVSKISTLITNDTFAIRSGDTTLAYFGYDEETGTSISEMDNLTINNYLTSGYHRTEKFDIDGEQRTGVFYVGGEE